MQCVTVFECPMYLGPPGVDDDNDDCFLVKVDHKKFSECSLDHLRLFISNVASIFAYQLDFL